MSDRRVWAIAHCHRSSVAWLAIFCAAILVIYSMYGGSFATIPCYIADISARAKSAPSTAVC